MSLTDRAADAEKLAYHPDRNCRCGHHFFCRLGRDFYIDDIDAGLRLRIGTGMPWAVAEPSIFDLSQEKTAPLTARRQT